MIWCCGYDRNSRIYVTTLKKIRVSLLLVKSNKHYIDIYKIINNVG
jgi:hypothetical protein